MKSINRFDDVWEEISWSSKRGKKNLVLEFFTDEKIPSDIGK